MGRREKAHKQGYESFIHEGGWEALYKTPVIFAPGLGETAEGSFKKPVKALANLGHDVYAVTHETSAADKKTLAEEKARMQAAWKQKYANKLPGRNADELFAAIPLTEFRKALALIEFIKREVRTRSPGQRVDVIGHSQGGAYVLIAAFLEPELFKHVILVNPAGQSWPESQLLLKIKFHVNLFFRNFGKNLFSKYFWDTLRTLVIKRMYFQALREGEELAKFNAYPFLDALGQIAPEVTKKTYFDDNDWIFRAKKIKQAAAIAKGKGNTLLGERKETKNGGHYNLIANPDDYAALFHADLAAPDKTEPGRQAA